MIIALGYYGEEITGQLFRLVIGAFRHKFRLATETFINKDILQ